MFIVLFCVVLCFMDVFLLVNCIPTPRLVYVSLCVCVCVCVCVDARALFWFFGFGAWNECVWLAVGYISAYGSQWKYIQSLKLVLPDCCSYSSIHLIPIIKEYNFSISHVFIFIFCVIRLKKSLQRRCVCVCVCVCLCAKMRLGKYFILLSPILRNYYRKRGKHFVSWDTFYVSCAVDQIAYTQNGTHILKRIHKHKRSYPPTIWFK